MRFFHQKLAESFGGSAHVGHDLSHTFGVQALKMEDAFKAFLNLLLSYEQMWERTVTMREQYDQNHAGSVSSWQAACDELAKNSQGEVA